MPHEIKIFIIKVLGLQTTAIGVAALVLGALLYYYERQGGGVPQDLHDKYFTISGSFYSLGFGLLLTLLGLIFFLKPAIINALASK